MIQLLDWLASLPPAVLYLVVAVAAFAENVFPPLPADTAIALGAFVAARDRDSVVGVWLATMIGNISGAMLMYHFGHRYGLPWLQKNFPKMFGGEGVDKFEAQYKRYGIPGVAVSRFLPGLRAIVPPVAGAMRIGAVRSAFAMTIASGAWYAMVSALAFRAGTKSDVLLATIGRSQKVVGIVAGVVLTIVLLVILWRRKSVQS